MSPTAFPGLFITLEGGDATGKSTQREYLGAWLAETGYEVVLTREPGGTDLGVTLRQAVLHGADLGPRTEALLYAADRAHHVESLVLPALRRGAIVVSDRYLDSSVAYQGAARELGTAEVRDLSLWATQNLLPDLTILLDLDPAAAARRIADREPDRLEREGEDFQERVRVQFRELAAAEPGRFRVVDAGDDPLTVHAAVVTHVNAVLAVRDGSRADAP